MLSAIKQCSWILLLFISVIASANVKELAEIQPLAGFQQLTNFGDNPGELTASYFHPSEQAESLVVFLHGCVQEGESLAQQSGFVALAKQHNFTLLLPQQNQKNNVKSCFNWFSEQDSGKNQGEVLSIKNMITTLKSQLGNKEVYIAGISAGGAMTSALLIHYPELFSAGAVISGLPYPCANDLVKAISCMRNGPSQSPAELVGLAKKGRGVAIQWPRLIIITGSQDQVVNPKNSHYLASQWEILTANAAKKSKASQANSQMTLWQDQQQIPLIKLVKIDDIGHGLSVNSALGNRDSSAKYIFESSFDTASNIVEFWGF